MLLCLTVRCLQYAAWRFRLGLFLENEKVRQADFKTRSQYFSAAARADGIYKKRPRPFCIPVPCAEENLFQGIRETAIAYFRKREIRWHDGQNGKPSNHLCDSQVCCLNFLFAFANRSSALAELLRPVFPSIRMMLPMEDDKFVACEWIGAKNYLNERVPRSGARTRGANCTSADAAIMFERTDGKRQIVLIEWKYTESYSNICLTTAKSGTNRTAIYRPIFDASQCPIDRAPLRDFESLFYEPFYQFMRQQFLAHKMELANEQGADIVTVLHIAPAHNRAFRRVTSPQLASIDETATGVWSRLAGDGFMSVSTEELFGPALRVGLVGMTDWSDYVLQRYPWVGEVRPAV